MLLRRVFVFKIIPMLNPDGVIIGNYRCSLAGLDCNRQYQKPVRHVTPTIWYSKRVLQTFLQDRPVVMFCDFHGHSCKRNCFMYGCDSKLPLRRVAERMFCAMLSHNAANFTFDDCKVRTIIPSSSSSSVCPFN